MMSSTSVMGEISFAEYGILLSKIHEVCSEIAYDLKEAIPNFDEEEANLHKNKKINEIISLLGRLRLDSLILFEASRRANILSLTDQYLLKWSFSIERKILKQSIISYGDDIEIKLNQIWRKMHFPKFLDPLETEKLLSSNLKEPLAHEIVFWQFHGTKIPDFIPQHIIPLLQSTTPAIPTEIYLINRYFPVIHDKINETSFISKKTPWSNILEKIQNFGKPENPDFNKYEEQVILNKFSESPSEENDVKTLDGLKTLLEWKKSFQMRRVKTELPTTIINTIIKAWGKSNHKDDWIDDQSFGQVTTKTLFALWTNSDEREFAQAIGSAFQQQISLNLVYQPMIEETTPYNEISEISYINKGNLPRIRSILLCLRQLTKKIDRTIFFSYIYPALIKSLKKLNNNLIFEQNALISKDDELTINPRGNRTLITCHLIHEILVEISYQSDDDLSEAFENIVNPSTFKKLNPVIESDSLLLVNFIRNKQKFVIPGPLFGSTTHHALVSAFVLRVPNVDKRILMLENILNTFESFDHEDYYPLQKIILGIIEEKDIPEQPSIKKSLLNSRIFTYRGVFLENIPQNLKEKFWNYLINIKFGGCFNRLRDDLILFYKKNLADPVGEMWAREAFNTVKKIPTKYSLFPLFKKYDLKVSEPDKLLASQKLAELQIGLKPL